MQAAVTAMIAMGVLGVTRIGTAGGLTAWINEVRIDQPGADDDEYAELRGEPGAVLNGLTYIVIGDGSGDDGTIEAAVSLDGFVLDGNGYLVIADDSAVLGVPADIAVSINFENGDNVTHALVAGFTGTAGDDLDLDNDGRLDASPWTDVLDTVALVESLADPPVGTEWWYGDATVGPDEDGLVPSHVYRCAPDGVWVVGPADPTGPNAADTPGSGNAMCPDAAPCPGDINNDLVVNQDDLVEVVLAWGLPASPADVDGSGAVNVDDLILVLVGWGECG